MRLALLSVAVGLVVSAGERKEFTPGEVWLDTEGKAMQAHSAGIVEHKGVWYWYGEDKTLGNFNRTGVAVADKPEGPFRFLHHRRPIRYDFGYKEKDRTNQRELGGTFRDMNLFLDDDGRANVLYAPEDNWTLYIVRLNAEFTGAEEPAVEGKTWARALVNQMREAPAPFKHKGKHYLITSGCTGWNPNRAGYAVAGNMLGPWEDKGDPSLGAGAETTFRSQSTLVLPAPGKTKGAFIFMADRWNPKKLEDSRYVWLPFRVSADGRIELKWRDSWDLSIFDHELK